MSVPAFLQVRGRWEGMPWLPFVLMVIAGVFFLLSAWRVVPYAPRFVPLGLAFLTAGLIFEFVFKTTSGLVIIH